MHPGSALRTVVEHRSRTPVPQHIPNPCSATSIVATLHWRACSFSVEKAADGISSTGGLRPCSATNIVVTVHRTAHSLSVETDIDDTSATGGRQCQPLSNAFSAQ